MRKQLFLLIGLLMFCLNMEVRATQQSGELLIIGKDTLTMLTWPLEIDSIMSKEVQKRVKTKFINTGCWRRYIGIWRLDSGKLYLERITDNSGEKPFTYVSTDSLFDKYKDKQGRIFASWINGKLRIIKGKYLDTTYSKYQRAFTDETIYQVKNGKVKDKKSYQNTVKPASISTLEAIRIVQNNFNKDLFPELSGQKLLANVKLLTDANGKIDSLQLCLIINSKEQKECSPNHPYIKELRRCFDLVPDWNVLFLYGKREWLNFIFIVRKIPNKQVPQT